MYFGIACFVAVTTFSTMMGLTAQPATAQASSPPQIVTTATGEATVVPDRAIVNFAVEVHAQTAAAAAGENARKQRAIVEALHGKGVATEHITTSGFSVSPDERYDDGQRKVIGYIARNGVVINVQKVELVGGLIDVALGAGANSVGELRFYSSQYDEFRRFALRQAVERASADAEVMAKAVGGTLGDPIELSTIDADRPREVLNVAFSAALRSSDAAATPVVAGEQKITVSVSTRWILRPGR